MDTLLRVTLLSNGHGEDAVGASLARALLSLQPDLRVQAFPLVDAGDAYAALPLPVLGPRRTMPSGGLLLHAPSLLWGDLRAGFLGMTGQQLAQLSRLCTDVLVVVGDVYALALSGLVRACARFYVQTLVSAHHRSPRRPALHRSFMEGVRLPERALMRRLAARVYVRDAATAQALQEQGVRHAFALGNPMLDGLAGNPMPEHMDASLRVALLPGTRAYAASALQTMLRALEHLPLPPESVAALIAWAGGEPPPAPPGWGLERSDGGRARYLSPSGVSAHLYRGRFADVLQTASLVVGTSGTANEQAAALGRPVVAFPVPPLYRPAFLTNQQRLLGDALTVVPADPIVIAGALHTLHMDPVWLERAARVGRERMGPAGGGQAIAQDILRHLSQRLSATPAGASSSSSVMRERQR